VGHPRREQRWGVDEDRYPAGEQDRADAGGEGDQDHGEGRDEEVRATAPRGGGLGIVGGVAVVFPSAFLVADAEETVKPTTRLATAKAATE